MLRSSLDSRTSRSPLTLRSLRTPCCHPVHAALPAVAALLMAAVAASCASGPGGAAPGAPAEVVQSEQQSGTRSLLIAISPVNENVVWVAGTAGTYVRTTDGGATWHAAKVPGADSLQFRDVHAIDADNAFLLSIGNGAQSRIYRTSDAGHTWTEQYRVAEPEGFLDCFDFWDAERGVVIGDAVDGRIYVLTTSNGGRTWTRVPESALPPAMEGEGSFAASGTCTHTREGGQAWIVSNNPQHARLLHTADYGRTWTIDTLPISTHSGTGAESITFRDRRNGMALGGGTTATPADMLTAVTGDGGHTWTQRSRPPLARGIWGGVYVPGARVPTVVAVGPDGAVYTRDEAQSWIPINSFNYWAVGFASPDAGWAVGQAGRITKLSGF